MSERSSLVKLYSVTSSMGTATRSKMSSPSFEADVAEASWASATTAAGARDAKPKCSCSTDRPSHV